MGSSGDPGKEMAMGEIGFRARTLRIVIEYTLGVIVVFVDIILVPPAFVWGLLVNKYPKWGEFVISKKLESYLEK